MSRRADGIGSDQVDDHVRELLRVTIQRSHPSSGGDDVSRCLLFFLVRVANTWRSIRTLRKYTPDQEGFAVDAAVLLRAMFDAYLQAAFIVHDPNRRNERARAYLDFEHVERYKFATKVTSHDNPLANGLKASPKRPEGEKRLRDHYDRVKGTYLTQKRRADGTVKQGPRTRNKWYVGDLSTIARAVGREAEYDFFVANFHGCVHSSALAVGDGPMFPPAHVLRLASMIAARVAEMSVRYNAIDLGDFYRPILDELCKDFFHSA